MKTQKSSSRIMFVDSSGQEHELKAQVGKTLLEIAVDKSVDIAHSCGGMGSCGTCRVRLKVLTGSFPVRNELEMEMAHDRGFTTDERLSCQLEIPETEFSWTVEALGSSDEEW